MMNLITNHLLKSSKHGLRNFNLTLKEIVFDDDWDETLEELIKTNQKSKSEKSD
jgi:hypothetical protein